MAACLRRRSVKRWRRLGRTAAKVEGRKRLRSSSAEAMLQGNVAPLPFRVVKQHPRSLNALGGSRGASSSQRPRL
jgi:hypothetical protein